MTRVPEVTERDQVPEAQRHHFDAIMASRSNRRRPYSFLLHCPDLAARTAHLVGYSLFESDFPKDQKELAICAVAREFDCPYGWAAHELNARTAGVRERDRDVSRSRRGNASPGPGVQGDRTTHGEGFLGESLCQPLAQGRPRRRFDVSW